MDWFPYLRWALLVFVLAWLGKWMYSHKAELDNRAAMLSPRHWWGSMRKWSRVQVRDKIVFTVLFTIALLYVIPLVSYHVAAATGTPIIVDQSECEVAAAASTPIFLMMALPIIVIFEEGCFRHFILGFYRERNWMIALGFSTIAFATWHLFGGGVSMGIFPVALIAGFILGVAYMMGGLFVAVGSHLLYDVVAVMIIMS